LLPVQRHDLLPVTPLNLRSKHCTTRVALHERSITVLDGWNFRLCL
jgi:hypothetical protein